MQELHSVPVDRHTVFLVRPLSWVALGIEGFADVVQAVQLVEHLELDEVVLGAHLVDCGVGELLSFVLGYEGVADCGLRQITVNQVR